MHVGNDALLQWEDWPGPVDALTTGEDGWIIGSRPDPCHKWHHLR